MLSIREQLGIPIKLVGTGEKAEDLQSFQIDTFVEGLLQIDETEE